MIAIRLRDRLIVIGGYVVEPLRSVWRTTALMGADLDLDDFKATVAVVIYFALGTAVVAWAASMAVLVRWIVGV